MPRPTSLSASIDLFLRILWRNPIFPPSSYFSQGAQACSVLYSVFSWFYPFSSNLHLCDHCTLNLEEYHFTKVAISLYQAPIWRILLKLRPFCLGVMALLYPHVDYTVYSSTVVRINVSFLLEHKKKAQDSVWPRVITEEIKLTILLLNRVWNLACEQIWVNHLKV